MTIKPFAHIYNLYFAYRRVRTAYTMTKYYPLSADQ